MPSRALAPAGGLEGGSKNVRSEVKAAGRVAEPVGARGKSETFRASPRTTFRSLAEVLRS
eukprot:6453361-Prymnesium_polylepis.1